MSLFEDVGNIHRQTWVGSSVDGEVHSYARTSRIEELWGMGTVVAVDFVRLRNPYSNTVQTLCLVRRLSARSAP